VRKEQGVSNVNIKARKTKNGECCCARPGIKNDDKKCEYVKVSEIL
jgi:hypothetical protein